jgi:hypothetical protein
MHLRYNFEEEFSQDILSKLTKRVASNMSRSVVALASFSGNRSRYKLLLAVTCQLYDNISEILESIHDNE